VLVLGTPRGGTSLVAGVCQMLGVSMGRDLDHSNVEDRRFQELLASQDIVAEMTSYFAELTTSRRISGVKNPVIIDRLSEFYSVIPTPILVVVARDVVAVAQREESCGHDLLESLHSAARRESEIFHFVEAVADPLVMVSYERALASPTATARALSDFILGAVNEHIVELTSRLVRSNCDMPGDVDFVRERELYDLQTSGAVTSLP
jgi:hypothetical protein